MCDKQQVFCRIFICQCLNSMNISIPCTHHCLSPLRQLEFLKQRTVYQPHSLCKYIHPCLFIPWNSWQRMKKKKPKGYSNSMHTSSYTRSTVLSTVPAGSIASSSEILKPKSPSLGAKPGLIASLFSISHNPYSIETWKLIIQQSIQLPSYGNIKLHQNTQISKEYVLLYSDRDDATVKISFESYFLRANFYTTEMMREWKSVLN